MTNDFHSFAKSLGEYFRNIRIEKELSVQQLADISGVSYSFISRFENGKQTDVSVIRLMKLARILNINTALLFRK